MAAGVVLRSADDRTALFTQWLAPHLPMVRGLVRRHTYFVGERADDYQTAVLHLLEHLDDLAHFALCLTARRDTAKLRALTANRPAPADKPSAQPTTATARDFDETRALLDKSALHPDERTPYLYAATAEIDESLRRGDEMLREVDETRSDADEALRTIDTAAVDFEALTDADDETLREVDETLREVDEPLRAIDTAAGNFDAMTDTDDETQPADDEDLRTIDTATETFEALTDTDNETRGGGDEALREVDETAVAFDETAAENATRAAAEDERQPYADAAPDEAERTPAPLPVTAEEVLRTVGNFNPRPWLAGVTLRLLSTLNHRALRHRETHLTPASADSDELFDPADPDGDLWAVGADPATADAQRQAAPSRWEESLGAGRERTGGSAGGCACGVGARRGPVARTRRAHYKEDVRIFRSKNLVVSLLLPKFALCHSLFFYKSKPDTLKVIKANEGDGAWRSWYPAGSRPCARHCIGISRTRLVGRGIDHFRCRHSRPRSPPFRSAPAAAPVLPRRRPVRALRRPPPPAECAHRPADLTFGTPPRTAELRTPARCALCAEVPHGLFRPQPRRADPTAPLGTLPSGRAL